MTLPSWGTNDRRCKFWQNGNWRGLVVPVALLLVGEVFVVWTRYGVLRSLSPSQIALAGVEALADGSIVSATAQTLAAAFAEVAIGR